GIRRRRTRHVAHPQPHGEERSPRDRGVVQGRGPRATRCGEGRRWRRALDQGNAVRLTMNIAVVDYGIGNLRSAEKALTQLGADARLTAAADEIEGAGAVVLPGVGNFGACMEALRASGLEASTR